MTIRQDNTMRHLFVSDIDGTLLRRDVPLTPQVTAAAREYVSAGGLLSICTGRSLPAACETALALGVNAPCILYGGAAIYSFQQRKYLCSRPFQWDVMRAVRSVLAQNADISVQVFTLDAVYVLHRNDRLSRWGVLEENTGPVRSPNEVVGPVMKLVMCCDDPSRLEFCRRFFPPEYCNYAFASRTFVDVVAAGLGKGDALKTLSQLTGIPCSGFFCAGDAITDLPMLELAGVSYAPENAMDAVKAAVSHVVPDVRHSGMARAFQHAASLLEKEEA